MSLYNPIRGGTRGGRDQFKWEDVRLMTYKDRDQYLGATVKTGYLDKGGKWRKKDWYTHEKKQDEKSEILAERKRIQMEDQKRMNKAFGIKVQDDDDQVKLNQLELQELTKRNQKDDEEDGLAGLGFALLIFQALNDKQTKNQNLEFYQQNFNKLEGEGIENHQKLLQNNHKSVLEVDSKKIKKQKKKEEKQKRKEEKRRKKEEKKKRKEEKRKKNEEKEKLKANNSSTHDENKHKEKKHSNH